MHQRRHGHVRQRSPGTWEVRYTLGTESGTGKRRSVTTTVKGERKDAERELRRLLRTLDTGEHVDPTRMNVKQWLEFWLSAVREEVSPKSHERYEEIVRNFLMPELGALAITKLSPVHIQAAYGKWAVGGRRDGKSGGLVHRILRSALARAVEQQVLARNPADVFKKRLPKVDRREMVTLTTEQATTLLNALKRTRVYGPVLIALATGMRRGEILALRWRNVDLERAILRVVESLEQTKGGVLRFKGTKTDKARAITLPSFAVQELRRLKREQAEELLAVGIRQSGQALVCARADGEAHQPRSLTHEFTYLVGRCKDIPRMRFHDLRHSHATQLLRAGVHPKVAQERLGHSTISTTLDLYTHVTETMQKDAADELDRAFRSAMTSAQSQN